MVFCGMDTAEFCPIRWIKIQTNLIPAVQNGSIQFPPRCLKKGTPGIYHKVWSAYEEIQNVFGGAFQGGLL